VNKIIKRILWRMLKIYGSCDFYFYKYGIGGRTGKRYHWAFRAMTNYLHINWYGKECCPLFIEVERFPF